MIAIESLMSLHVETFRPPLDGGDPIKLGYGTAFVVAHEDRWGLLTNLHVLTGRDPVTNTPTGSAALPTILHVWHNAETAGTWVGVDYHLYDESGRAVWYEHPNDPTWDMGLINIRPQEGYRYYPYRITPHHQRQIVVPGTELSTIGFPFGTSSDGRFAIWSRATVASDLDIDYTQRPTFLVDSRSREGQSGSPVIFKNDHMSADRSGNVYFGTGRPSTELMGMYSGRISAESDLGIVWKVDAIEGLLSRGIRSNRTIDD